MTTLAGYLCLGNQEIINVNRVTTYGRGALFTDECQCPALDIDETYTNPEDDDAPWYDADHPESADFLGLMPQSITLSVPTQRSMTEVLDEGSVLGRERRPGRVIEVIGWMIARTSQGMWWGERWLQKELRGQGCQGGCGGDELTLLPYCRPDGDVICDYLDIFIDEFACSDCLDPPDCDTFGVYDGTHISFDADFRSLFGAGLVDGPRWAPVSDDDEFIIQTAQFQIGASVPWLYSQPVLVSEGDAELGSTDCTIVTTDEWTDGEAITLTVTAGPGGVSFPGIHFTMTYTLDGSCPEDRVPASVSIWITHIAPEGSITIDGATRRVIYHNPTSHRDEPGFDHLEWEGAWCWPTIPACTTMCVCIRNESGPAVDFTIERRKREL